MSWCIIHFVSSQKVFVRHANLRGDTDGSYILNTLNPYCEFQHCKHDAMVKLFSRNIIILYTEKRIILLYQIPLTLQLNLAT